MTRIVISGYYGFGNVGDEAVLASILSGLRERIPDAQCVVLSADPAGTMRLHGVPGIARAGPAMLSTITGADLFISGGGSLIQDATSARSALYYLGIVAFASRAARRSMVYAQGLGPIRRRWIRTLAARTLNRVHVISFRDEDSQRLAQEIGVRRPTHLVADPVFALDPATPSTRVANMLSVLPHPRIGLALRPVARVHYVAAVIEAIRSVVQQTGGSVVPLVFHPRHDQAIARQVAEAVGATPVSNLPPSEMMGVVGSLDVLAGVRLHALIAAVAAGVPPVGLSYDPKVESLFRKVGAGYLLPVASLSPDALRQSLLSAWGGRDALRPTLRAAAARLREEAIRGADLATTLLSMPARL